MGTKISWCDHRQGSHFVKQKRANGIVHLLVYCPKHPNAIGKGHLLAHRYFVEKHLQRYLDKDEHVHHVNHNPLDNRIENLQVVSASEHQKLHLNSRTEIMHPNSLKAIADSASRRKLERIEVACACGCEKTLITPDHKGRYRKYLPGHSTTGKTWKWSKNVNKNTVG